MTDPVPSSTFSDIGHLNLKVLKEAWKPTTSRQREHPFLYSFVYRTVAPLPTSIGTTVKWPPPCKIYFMMKHKIIEHGRTINNGFCTN